MAATVIAVLKAHLLGVPGGDPADVDKDTTQASYGSMSVDVDRIAGNGGHMTVDQIAEAIFAACSNGPCTVIVSQGAGTVSQVVTQ